MQAARALSHHPSPIIPRTDIQQVRFHLCSRDHKRTQLFYKTIGFKESSCQQYFTLKCINSSHSSTALQFLPQADQKIQKMFDPDQRSMFTSLEDDTSSPTLSYAESWIPLLRCKDIEKTMQFYRFVGDWQKEKHGNGPIHYSLTLDGQVMEIYPLRAKYLADVEFIIPVKQVKTTVELLQDHKFTLLNQNSTRALFADPDERLVQILEKLEI